MSTPWTDMTTRDGDISEALGKCADAVTHAAPGRWEFVLSNGVDLRVGARLDDDWLLLDSSPAVEPGWAPWQALRWHAGLSSGVKFALARTAAQLQLRAELPLVGDCDLKRRIRDACSGLKTAAAHAAGVLERDPHTAGAASANDEAAATAAPGVSQLCSETAWRFIEREPGTAMVDLEVPGRFQQAVVQARASGGVTASVALATEIAEPLSPARGHALGLLMLRTCGVVRMARAAADGDDGAGARFEVVFASAPHPAELAHAIAALAVASQLAVREASVLASDEVIAREYLKASPWALVPGP